MESLVDANRRVVHGVFDLLGGHAMAPSVVFALVITVTLLIIWIIMGRGPVGWVLGKLNLGAKCGAKEGFTPNPNAPGVASRWAVPERTDTGASERTDRFMNLVSKGVETPSVADVMLAQSTFAGDGVSTGSFTNRTHGGSGAGDSVDNLANFSDKALAASNFAGNLGLMSSR